MTLLLAKTFSVESRELWFQLRQDYFLEEVLRPVFIWGCGLGTILFVLALFWKDSRLKTTALVALAATGLLVVPYLDMRREATQKTNPQGDPSPRLTTMRMETRWVFFTLSGLAVATLVWGARARLGPALTGAAAVGGVAATLTGLWLEAYESGAMHYTRRSPAPSAGATPLAGRDTPPFRERTAATTPRPRSEPRREPPLPARKPAPAVVSSSPSSTPTPAPPPVLKTSGRQSAPERIPRAIPVE